MHPPIPCGPLLEHAACGVQQRGGLAPLYVPGTRPEDELSEQERACIVRPMREYQARLARRGNKPGEIAGDEFIRLAAAGLRRLEQLRTANDGEVDIDLDGPFTFKVT